MEKIRSDLNKCVDISYDILKYVLRYNKDYVKDISMALVSLTAFLIYYGMKDIDTIISAYKNTEYTVTKRKLKLSGSKVLPSGIECTGLSIPNITILETPNNFKAYLSDEIKVKKSKKESNMEHLENFLHEMNHIIKSQNKRIIHIDHDRLIIRNGIIKFEYNTQTLSLKSRIHEYTEEGFNELQTEDLLEIVQQLCNVDIKNKYAKKYLDKIRKEIKTYTTKTYYKPAMCLVEPLYLDQKFRNEYINGCMTGNIDSISDNFDYYVSDGAFEELTSSIDEYYNSSFSDDAMKKAVNLVVGYQYSKKK